ncbi:MAG: P-loop NTPase [Halopseudomonas sp.]
MSDTPVKSDVRFIELTQQTEDCGLGHACSFCPGEQSCRLDKAHHDKHLVERRLDSIDWVLLVMANKGGVGKSTVSANLSVALAKQGYRVGLADADIHGPNAPRIFGLHNERVKVAASGIPTPRFSVSEGGPGVQVGSLGFFLAEADTPVVWRDAYKHDYIHHMVGSFDWGELDFLVVDMPPGTGNELITLTDMLEGSNVRGILVSSADAIALQDTLKAARFCKERGVPLLGLVENYAGTICPHCGGEFEMFPRAKEIEAFEASEIETLIRVPFAADIANGASQGAPAASVDGSPIAELFDQLAAKCRQAVVETSAEEFQQQLSGVLSHIDDLDEADEPLQEAVKALLEQEQQRLSK